jgi:uncharacterized membrane protein YphA (DoxX/SURF4 family)
MISRELLMFGPLPVRIMAGMAFIVAGLPKFENISVVAVLQGMNQLWI